MAGLNVAEWSPEQVADWLTGLEEPVVQYVAGLRARGLDGRRLLMLRCDDLEYLGVEIIGHQELILEAVEHLRNFQFETGRECIQQLALRVSVLGGALARGLRAHSDARLDTQVLADVARHVHAVLPLACWLERWALSAGGAAGGTVAARRAGLLRLALEAATSAQRERFCSAPARAVALCAARAAAAADHLVRAELDPAILSVAALDAVCVRQRQRPLGFDVAASPCGHHQVRSVRFGSPAHASGQLHAGDEIVAVGGQCVVGWGGGAVLAACRAQGDELALRLRRRGARPPPAAARALPPALPPPPPPVDSEDDSEPLSPPASPDHLSAHTRMYPPKPSLLVQRRHSFSGGAGAGRALAVEQLWHALQAARQERDAGALLPRDKAVSCAGLETPARRGPAGAAPDDERRARLDKSHSTPAYDLQPPPPALPESPPAPPPAPPPPPEEPPEVTVQALEKAGQIREFLKSSSVIGEAMSARRDPAPPASPAPPAPPAPAPLTPLGTGPRDETTTEKILETINIAMMEHRRRSLLEYAPPSAPPSPRAAPLPLGVLRAVPRPAPRPAAPAARAKLHIEQISSPLRNLTALDMRAPPVPPAAAPPVSPAPPPDIVVGALAEPRGALSPTSMRGIFPSSKSRSLKKKSSLLAKRRSIPIRALVPLGACGAVWHRVRARHAAAAPRWARRQLLLTHNLLYAYRTPECARASCMIQLAGCTASAAGEVKSRAHAFKVYHTGTAFYFACDTRDAMLAWIQLIHRATLLPPLQSPSDATSQFSETDYSETESDEGGSGGSLRARAGRSEEQEHVPASAAASLDRKYLRFFSRNKKDDSKSKNKQPPAPAPPEQYRSYPAGPDVGVGPAVGEARHRMPKPINYIHASNPNLLDFEKSDFVTKPKLHPPKVKGTKGLEVGAGLVTLEQFMLQKQAEERRGAPAPSPAPAPYCPPPDVIYGERPAPRDSPRHHGYEKLEAPSAPAPAPPERWRDSLRRHDKVAAARGAARGTAQGAGAPRPASPAAQRAPDADSWNNNNNSNAGSGTGGGGGAVSRLRLVFGAGAQSGSGAPGPYPHLQCPPLFHAETYSLRSPRPEPPPRMQLNNGQNTFK